MFDLVAYYFMCYDCEVVNHKQVFIVYFHSQSMSNHPTQSFRLETNKHISYNSSAILVDRPAPCLRFNIEYIKKNLI